MTRTVVLAGSDQRFHEPGLIDSICQKMVGDGRYYKLAIPFDAAEDPAVVAFLAEQVRITRSLAGTDRLIVVCESDRDPVAILEAVAAHDVLDGMRIEAVNTAFNSEAYRPHGVWALRCMDPRLNASSHAPSFAEHLRMHLRMPTRPNIISFAGGGADDTTDQASTITRGLKRVMEILDHNQRVGTIITSGHTDCRRVCAGLENNIDQQVRLLVERLHGSRALAHMVSPEIAVEALVCDTAPTHMRGFLPTHHQPPTPILGPR